MTIAPGEWGTCPNRMLKKPASFVLACRGGSTYEHKVRLASSAAAALLDGLFEHPEKSKRKKVP